MSVVGFEPTAITILWIVAIDHPAIQTKNGKIYATLMAILLPNISPLMFIHFLHPIFHKQQEFLLLYPYTNYLRPWLCLHQNSFYKPMCEQNTSSYTQPLPRLLNDASLYSKHYEYFGTLHLVQDLLYLLECTFALHKTT